MQTNERTRTQMCGNIGECQIKATSNDDFRRIAVFSGAHKSSIINGALYHFVGTRLGANNTNIIGDGWMSQGQVLSDQHTDANTTKIESVQELMRILF